jgi:chemotaxis protein MotB
MSGKKSVIVKKVKKAGHGGHHGGSWKVAYADFVTAMMAFFLLLWLLTMNSDEKRARISAYFKHFSIFSAGGTSFMEKSSSMFRESGPTEQKVFQANNRSDVLANNEHIEDAFQKKLTESLSEGKDQVEVNISNDKIRIQMIDKEGREMFERGSSTLTETAKKILKAISDNIMSLPNEISIEGHTDSIPLNTGSYTNWELSADRAATARRELESDGIDPSRIREISGHADREPYVKNNPDSPKNRRITVVIDPYVRLKEPIRDETTGKIVAWKGVDNLTLKKLEEILFKTKEKLKNKAGLRQPKADVPKKESWGPIIKKEDWNPVMKDNSMNPVISSDNWNPVVKGYQWKPVQPQDGMTTAESGNNSTTAKGTTIIEEQANVPEDPSVKEMRDYFDSAIKRKMPVSPNIEIETLKSAEVGNSNISGSEENPSAAKGGQAWGPVIKKDEWNPVIKKDTVNVLK